MSEPSEKPLSSEKKSRPAEIIQEEPDPEGRLQLDDSDFGIETGPPVEIPVPETPAPPPVEEPNQGEQEMTVSVGPSPTTAGKPFTRTITVKKKDGLVQTIDRRVRSNSHPKGYRPTFRRTDAKRPLVGEEAGMVLLTAKEMPWKRRNESNLTKDGKYTGGFEEQEDPTFVYRTCAVLLAFAMHISVLPTLTSKNLTSKEGILFLEWIRPKEAVNPWMTVPVPDEIKPWLAEYLDLPKPTSTHAYAYMFKRLSEKVQETYGVDLHLTALRFRHGGLTSNKNELGLTDQETAVTAGSTVRTVQTYASMFGVTLAKKMKEKGKDSLLASMEDKALQFRQRKSPPPVPDTPAPV